MTPVQATILKQTALSSGCDLATNRDVLTHKIDLSDAGNKINVGVWKDSDGVIKESNTITKLQSVDHVNNCYSTSYGIKGGNGSANPVVGYIVKKDSTTNAIETAQMK